MKTTRALSFLAVLTFAAAASANTASSSGGGGGGSAFANNVFNQVSGNPRYGDGPGADQSDGCYARAAAICKDIETGAFGQVPPGCQLQMIYTHREGPGWRYHVACMLVCDEETFVIDPLLDGVVSGNGWRRRFPGSPSVTGPQYGPNDTTPGISDAERQRAQGVIDSRNP
jgi:hypothetical protein